MSTVLAVAPHPDDETLGCGGALLKHRAEGNDVHWLIVTHVARELGYDEKYVEKRELEIEKVATAYDFTAVHHLQHPTTRLDTLPKAQLVDDVGEVFEEVTPAVVYVPYRNDIHTDHAVVFDAVAACSKWFRYPSLRRVMAYETLSETGFVLNPDVRGFRPNVYMDISDHVDDKVDIMQTYESEVNAHPFPRSESSIRALATLRGAASGCEAAEAFMLLRERID